MFGTDSTAFDAEATRLALEIAEVNKAEGLELNALDREQILRKLYETTYRIHNHYVPNPKPMGLAIARQKEETFLYSQKVVDYQRFVDLKMHQVTGLSLQEFFDLPAAEVEVLFKMAELTAKREKVEMDQQEARLKAAIQAGKAPPTQ